MSGPWVLMYHRVCERDASTKCWFERGTAVTPAALDRQLAWLLERFDVVPLEELHEPHARADRSRVALTFDDGYADTLSLAAPICARRGVVATCFASAGPAMGGPPLWFDVWYSLVHAGLGQAGWSTTLRELGLPDSPDIESSVRGAGKQWLASLAVATRCELLDRLASRLGVPVPSGLHLDVDGLRRLRALGWRIGGHGVDHVRLSDCDPTSLQQEVLGSLRLLADVGERRPMQFAYPDGALSDAVVRAVSDAGFAFACTVQSAPWRSPNEFLAVPRLFARSGEYLPHPALANAG